MNFFNIDTDFTVLAESANANIFGIGYIEADGAIIRRLLQSRFTIEVGMKLLIIKIAVQVHSQYGSQHETALDVAVLMNFKMKPPVFFCLCFRELLYRFNARQVRLIEINNPDVDFLLQIFIMDSR